jgi:transcriptional regulator with XRE-family HTH domain
MVDRDTKTTEELVGGRVKERRSELGITQVELAEAMQALGHSWIQTTVAKTEAADRPLRVNELTDLAHVLDVSVADLVTPESDLERSSLAWSLEIREHIASRLEREAAALTEQLAQKNSALEGARQRVRETRDRLAELGAVEVDGEWIWPDSHSSEGFAEGEGETA